MYVLLLLRTKLLCTMNTMHYYYCILYYYCWGNPKATYVQRETSSTSRLSFNFLLIAFRLHLQQVNCCPSALWLTPIFWLTFLLSSQGNLYSTYCTTVAPPASWLLPLRAWVDSHFLTFRFCLRMTCTVPTLVADKSESVLVENKQIGFSWLTVVMRNFTLCWYKEIRSATADILPGPV